MSATVRIIEYWYNRQEHSWVVQLKDSKRNQIGSADYVGRKEHALNIVASYRKKYPNAIVKKT